MRIQRMIVSTLVAGISIWAGTAYGQSGACTPITSVPITITTPGVYCLTGNLTGQFFANGSAIEVDSSSVVIDFNGYRLLNNNTGDAIGVKIQDRKNVTIRNGLISDFREGIESWARGTIVEDMKLSDNETGIWILASGGAVIRRNYCRRSAVGIAVSGFDPSIVVDNDVIGRVSDVTVGISVSGYALVVGNRLSRLTNGVQYPLYGSGKYRDNLTTDVAVPYSGGIDAGNNN